MNKYKRRCDCGKLMKLISIKEDSYNYGIIHYFWCPYCGSLGERSIEKHGDKNIHDHKLEKPKTTMKKKMVK